MILIVLFPPDGPNRQTVSLFLNIKMKFHQAVFDAHRFGNLLSQVKAWSYDFPELGLNCNRSKSHTDHAHKEDDHSHRHCPPNWMSRAG
jgi:hypothetical protein